MPVYRHRQSSRLLTFVTLLFVVATAVAALAGAPRAVFVTWICVALVFALIALGFSSLTVEIDEEKLEWFFGPGIWRKRIERGDIASVAVVRNPWWYGFGIHLTPRGWLYNVGGLDAVEITLAGGRTLRIGSDEPERFAAALRVG